ncbi:MAG: AAA family ATPase [Coxiellaceae bacterium]|nr:AAA family ATPase [Coxiellaceae bacterium]
MQRDIYHNLLKWKNKKDRKPLVLKGARQIGKTHIIKAFAKAEFEHVLFLDFEENKLLSSFFEQLTPKRIIENLSAHFGQAIDPANTVLIFDEVQASPEALNSLKYFYEQMPEQAIIAAGSLLGVKINNTGFPVGKVNFLSMYPLSFFEYLDATGHSSWRQYLEKAKPTEQVPEAMHQELQRELRYYLMVGGMPEAVNAYISSGDLVEVRQVQKDILAAYQIDFAKHAPKGDVMRIHEVWESVPNQLAKENKKFMFSAIKKSARAREYESAIQWLKQAGLLYCVEHVSKPAYPLKAYADKGTFKVYLLDVGLLSAMTDVPISSVTANDQILQELKGAITENYVLQCLVDQIESLYYWSSGGTAEIDFLIEQVSDILPLEVKLGVTKHKKSLQVYRQKYQPPLALRTSPLNFDGQDCFLNVPLYAISLLKSESFLEHNADAHRE